MLDGEEFQNIYVADGAPAYTEQCKQKAVEMVSMNNTHRCATAINGCKKMLMTCANMDKVAVK